MDSKLKTIDAVKTYSLSEAYAELSKLIDLALAGEPQRVIAHGDQAVMIVSEKDWRVRQKSAPTLGALLARYARDGKLSEENSARPWKDRPLGSDVE